MTSTSICKLLLEVGSQDIPVAGPMLCAKARDLAVFFAVDEKFKVTQAWPCTFRSRCDAALEGVAEAEDQASQDIAQG